MADDTPKNPELEAAEIAKTKAETAKLEAETRQAVADAAIAEAKAQVAFLDLEELQKRAEEIAASDDEHRVFKIGTIDATSVRSCLNTLARWHRIDPTCRITLVLNSPGGSVFDGLHLCDYLEELADAGHEVVTRVEGVAASMAGVVAQVGQVREIGRNSFIHQHEVSTGALGKASDLEDTAELAKRLTMQICEIYARRGKKTAKQIYRMMERHEVYLSAEEALAAGYVDRIV